jgi:hypothetical protein
VHATPEMRLLARILATQIASGSEVQRTVHHDIIDAPRKTAAYDPERN